MSYTDGVFEWKVKDVIFDKLTLLVGASGVGKTQILRSIISLQRIADGASLNGVKWQLKFELGSDKMYTWQGEFENQGFSYSFNDDEDESEKNKKKPKLISESLKLNNKLIFTRTKDATKFNGKSTLKLSPELSLLHILKEENQIKPVVEGFERILFSDQAGSQQEPFRINLINTQAIKSKFKTLRKIQQSNLDIRLKLYLTYENDKITFNKIKERFCEIFPQVYDLKIEPLDPAKDNIPFFYKEYPFIQLKEKGISKWIQQGKISSGMFRTLIQISELYLCPEGTIFLIDEFENSLGINCIDELTNDVLKSSRNIQFIITSHHPYIINNIDFANWKIVMRNSGIVQTAPISKFISGNSKHDKFMQLLQLPQYESGKA